MAGRPVVEQLSLFAAFAAPAAPAPVDPVLLEEQIEDARLTQAASAPTAPAPTAPAPAAPLDALCRAWDSTGPGGRLQPCRAPVPDGTSWCPVHRAPDDSVPAGYPVDAPRDPLTGRAVDPETGLVEGMATAANVEWVPFEAAPTIEPGTWLLWRAAGCPTFVGEEDAEPYDGPCWWCGRMATGHGRPRSFVADTFPDKTSAARPDATHLCMACGWCWSERISLPGSMSAERVVAKAATGRRAIVCVRGGPPTRYLLLRLDDGRIGLWSTAASAALEADWTAAVKRLRSDPVDVGVCRFLEAVDVDDIGDAPVEKQRCYHHLAQLGPGRRWNPRTDSHRAEIRGFLLDPPDAPWVAVIGDGQKHQAIYSRSNTGRSGALWVTYLQRTFAYDRHVLRMLIAAIEALIIGGANDEEIGTGRYSPRDVALARAIRVHDPVVAVHRGGPVLDLALYLRRNRKELTA